MSGFQEPPLTQERRAHPGLYVRRAEIIFERTRYGEFGNYAEIPSTAKDSAKANASGASSTPGILGSPVLAGSYPHNSDP